MQESSTAAARPSKRTARARPAVATTDSRSRRRRMFTWVLLGGVVVLLVNAIIGENGYLATLHLRRTEAGVRSAVAQLRIENQRLQQERERLETDPAAIEHTIRQHLGFIRPGEVTVIVHETPALSAAPPR